MKQAISNIIRDLGAKCDHDTAMALTAKAGEIATIAGQLDDTGLREDLQNCIPRLDAFVTAIGTIANVSYILFPGPPEILTSK